MGGFQFSKQRIQDKENSLPKTIYGWFVPGTLLHRQDSKLLILMIYCVKRNQNVSERSFQLAQKRKKDKKNGLITTN